MNRWCERLGIAPPSLAVVVGHPEANVFALLIVTLLERGAPMTLREVAEALAAAGAYEAVEEAERALSRCRPARAPVYRDEGRYALDPTDAELDLWAFRLGL